ncbi:MAG: hypothetical protein ACK55I_24600, partial [bacterium]
VFTIKRQSIDDFGLTPVEEKLPYLYWNIKLHKYGERFIAGGTELVITEASKLLDKTLKPVCDTLRAHGAVFMKKHGVRRFWVIDSSDVVAKFVRKMAL